MDPGIYAGIPNAEYHASPGISKTGLSMFKSDPASLEWSRNCPEDDEVMAADIGDAIHAALLEPARYAAEYVISPKFDRRTTAGKENAAIFEHANQGRIILDADQGKMIDLIVGSAMAHPTARFLLQAAGNVEESIYWTDEATGELCKLRMDKRLTDHHIIVDVKSVDSLEFFQKRLEDFGYWLQDGMYSEGYEKHFGEAPGFLFLVVQTNRSLKRYPVAVYELDPQSKAEGRAEFRRLLDSYHDAKTRGEFPGVQTISRPYWAKR